MTEFKPAEKRSCTELLERYYQKRRTLDHILDNHKTAEKIVFKGTSGLDVYNITAPFVDMGKTIIAARVEERDSENSEVMFFEEKNQEWIPCDSTVSFPLQDPFVCKINNQLIFGGVETFIDSQKSGGMGWRTLFFRGNSIKDLNYFTSGPDGMKDIRLVQCNNGKIMVFTRPQGGPAGRGKIGHIMIENLEQLTIENINKANLLNNQFYSTEWGGVNQALQLKNGLLGILGHIACFEQDGSRHYYSTVFVFDPVSRKASPMEIIACRDDFPEGPAKRDDLYDVIFPGGIIRYPNGGAVLYAGVSDTEAHKISIPDPFLKYEQISPSF